MTYRQAVYSRIAYPATYPAAYPLPSSPPSYRAASPPRRLFLLPFPLPIPTPIPTPNSAPSTPPLPRCLAASLPLPLPIPSPIPPPTLYPLPLYQTNIVSNRRQSKLVRWRYYSKSIVDSSTFYSKLSDNWCEGSFLDQVELLFRFYVPTSGV